MDVDGPKAILIDQIARENGVVIPPPEECASRLVEAAQGNGGRSGKRQGPPTDRGEGGGDTDRHHLHCGAGMIRDAIHRLPIEQRKAFVRTLWPDLPDKLVELVSRFPEETRVNGSQLRLPPSWKVIGGRG